MDIQERFPECKQNGEYSWLENAPSYDAIVAAFGHTILAQVDDNDYQGDSRYLLQSGERYGHLNIGWGSCSGCDALQGCDTIAELQDLADSIEGDIKWFASKDEARTWFETHDWKGDYSWRSKEQADYVEQVLKVLGSSLNVRREDDGFGITEVAP